MRRTLFFLVLALSPCLAFLLPEKPARADQWQVLTPEEAARARAALQPGALLVLHCSACRDGVEVLRVVEATAEHWSYDRGQRVLRVRGRRLLQSEHEFAAGTYAPSAARFRASDASAPVTEREVDLAYAYVQRGPNRFACLALELGLPTSSVLPEIALPDAAWQTLVTASTAKLAAKPVAKPAPVPRPTTTPRRPRTASF